VGEKSELTMKKIILLLCIFITVSASAQSRFGSLRNKPAAQTPVPTDGFSYEQPREYEIADITVSGHKFYSPDAVISVSGLKIGDKLNVPGIGTSTAIKKIYDLGIFSDIEINATKTESDRIWLEIVVKERPRLSEFVFKGIKKGQATDLKDKIKFIKGQIVNDSRIKNIQLTVRKFFIDKGYLNTSVKIQQIPDTIRNNSVLLRIFVDKNRKVKINRLAIEGNEVYSDKKIKKKLKNTKEVKRTRIFKPSRYIATKFEEDKTKLLKFYNSQGYRDARIIKDSVYKHNRKTINLDLQLEEGRKYFYRNIFWTGNYVYKEKELAAVLDIKKGDVYNLEELEKRLNYSPNRLDITSLYMNDGYLAFNIEPVEVAVEGDSIDIEMRLHEGKQFDINKIIVNGNTKTSDHVVLREILTVPGQKFSRQDIIQTQQRLSSLGYFNPEKIDIQPIPDLQNNTVDIQYTVEERPSDQIELSGGWGGFYGFVGTLGLVFNNFSARKVLDRTAWRPLPSGDGQRLSLRFQANGRSFQSYSISFTEPWLGGRKPNSLSVSLSHNVQRSGFANNPVQVQANIPSASLQITGITVGLGRRLKRPDPYFSLNNSLALQIYNLNNYGFAYGFPFNTGVSYGLAFNTTLSRFSVDSPIFPRSGSEISLSASFTPPWSKIGSIRNAEQTAASGSPNQYRLIEYHKWMFDSKWYVNVVGKLVLSTRIHMGFIGRYGTDLGYTPFERFSVGGSGLTGQNFILAREIIALRGYNNNVIQPTERLSNGGSIQGGIVYNKYVFELRYPVSLNPSATIFVLAFAEGGNTWNTYKDFDPFKVYRSAGIGARIFMPAFGLIGLDYGIAFDDNKANPSFKQPFQFTIGQQLR
jgi:outer membrane protein insertion porin family